MTKTAIKKVHNIIRNAPKIIMTSLSVGATLMTLLSLASSLASHETAYKDRVLDHTHTGLAEIWASLIWNRFPKEIYPLFLSPLIQAGRIQEAQEKSRVYNLTNEDDIESYSGYLTVNKEYGSNMFFWFIPAQTKASEAPVLLWLNGGPALSSMVGALAENGPFRITETGRVRLYNVSWTRSFSMIYVDNPVGVGYSFTTDEAGMSTTLKVVTENLYSVLVQFFQLFPQYSKNDFYIGGQSFAGKYVPLLGCYIHDRNHSQRPLQIFINFKGIYVGAGFSDPKNMLPAFPDYLFSVGFISEHSRQELRQYFIALVNEQHGDKKLDSKPNLITELYIPLRNCGYQSGDHLLGKMGPISMAHYIEIFMRSVATRTKLHVGFAQRANLLFYSKAASNNLTDEIPTSVSRENAFLMDHYKVLHYSGNLDVIVNVPMVEAFLTNVAWSGQEQYRKSHSQVWWVEDEVAGWFVTIGNFTRVIVRNAGHMLPYDQPEWALDMMNRFIFDKPFGETSEVQNEF